MFFAFKFAFLFGSDRTRPENNLISENEEMFQFLADGWHSTGKYFEVNLRLSTFQRRQKSTALLYITIFTAKYSPELRKQQINVQGRSRLAVDKIIQQWSMKHVDTY